MKASPAAKVAAAATAVIAAVYIAAVIVLNIMVSAHLAEHSDDILAARLSGARHDPAVLGQPVSRAAASPGAGDGDGDAAPVFLWRANGHGAITGHSPHAPALTAALAARYASGSMFSVTADLASAGTFRLRAAPDGTSWLIAGQSLAGDTHTKHLLVDVEIIAGPFVLLAMFLGSLAVGLRALAPVERSRRRQLEFTADASHELRTPLSVIRAEADVALSAPRDPAGYRDALTRIHGESERLRQLVDDMLWLARSDSGPPPPGNEPVDLVTLAQACAERFRAVGPAVTAETAGSPVLISAPPEWIDRLAGVLVDNACRYAGPGGRVRIQVVAQGNRVSLTVEDSGPGIPEASRPRLFDRFHRATEHGLGAGLGLAIGDSIVRSTGGRWHVGDSPLGGALMSVSWRRSGRSKREVPGPNPGAVEADDERLVTVDRLDEG